MAEQGPKGPRATQPVAATEAKEPWSEYTLQDGSKIRARVLLHGFRRVVGEFLENGDPTYEFAMATAVELTAPDGLRNLTPPPQKLDG